jgi:transposase
MRTRTLQAPDKEQLERLAADYSFAEAAAMLGVHERTFSRWYNEAFPSVNPEHKSGPRPIQPPPKKHLLEVLASCTNQQTAEHFGVGYKTLARWLKEYDIEDRLFDQDEMLCLADAAREIGVSRMTLSNWFRLGQLPDAKKINGTRVMVPKSTVRKLKAKYGKTYYVPAMPTSYAAYGPPPGNSEEPVSPRGRSHR